MRRKEKLGKTLKQIVFHWLRKSGVMNPQKPKIDQLKRSKIIAPRVFSKCCKGPQGNQVLVFQMLSDHALDKLDA